MANTLVPASASGVDIRHRFQAISLSSSSGAPGRPMPRFASAAAATGANSARPLAIVSSNSNMVVKAARNGPLSSRAVVAKTIACHGASRHSSCTMGPASVSTIQRCLDIPFTGKGRDPEGDATRFSVISWIEPELTALIDRGIRSLIEQADDGIFKKVLECVNYLFNFIF